MDKAKKPKAYSYLRFSTPEQAHGDSRRRQSELAARYADAHGLELDDRSFEDFGISAYRGKNAEVGALRTFREAAEDGLIEPGSFLLVENLDRLSRATPRKALRLLEEICEAGITLVTLTDGRRYDLKALDQDFTSLMVALLMASRAHDESLTKGKRVREAWSNKRKNAAERPLTARCPAWLRLDRTTNPPRWEVLEDRAKIVRRVFEMTAKGMGQHRIAHIFNEEGVPTFGSAAYWHRTYVKKLLENEAVIGIFVPHTQTYDDKKRRVRTAGEPVPGYFPPIVPLDLYEDVRAMRLEGRSHVSTKSARPVHMLAGLARCGLCGAAMTRVYKGAKNGQPKLVCTVAKAKGGCSYQTVSVDAVEDAIAASVDFVVLGAPSGDDQLDAALERLETLRDAVSEQIWNVVDALALSSGSPSLRERLSLLETEQERLTNEHDALLTKIAATSGASVERRLEAVRAAIASEGDKAEINALLRQVLKGVVVDRASGRLRFLWKHGGESELMFAWPEDGGGD